MTDDYRGPPGEEKPIDRWFRHRWRYGSVFVLNIDKVICDPSGTTGALIELKHIDAEDKSWTVTGKLAERLGWWALLLEHDGAEPLFATAQPPEGVFWTTGRFEFDAERFDQWVIDTFGAQPR